MRSPSTLVDIQNLSINYRTSRGSVSAVDDVSLQIPRGSSLGLVGESGSGKSTVAMGMMRLLPPNASMDGRILFEDTDLNTLSETELNQRWRWRNAAMVFQRSMSALSPVHRIGDQMRDVLALHEPNLSSAQVKERIEHVLQAVHLPQRVLRSYAFELSGGMMQRTMIALSLICNPPLVIFDEATTALDVITQSQILSEIQRLKQEFDLTTLVISHDVGVINATTDFVAVLYAGQLMEVAPRKVFFSGAKHPYSQALIESVPRLGGSAGRISGIPGSLPDLVDPPQGCRFAPRCPHATENCTGATPRMLEIAPGHKVRCTELAIKNEMAS